MSNLSGGGLELPTKIDRLEAKIASRAGGHAERFPLVARWAILFLYALVVGTAVVHHEPWADEAQAWLIAKSLPFWTMLFGQLHYEGSPGLWHTLLWFLSHAGLPYGSMFWLAWLAAVCGCWFLLKYSPFPLILRALIPFTFYLAYQFAVVARSYVLMPLLLFAAVHLIRTKTKRSIVFGLIAGLLANCNVFGFFLSMGLTIVYLWQFRESGNRKNIWRLAIRGAIPYLLLMLTAAGSSLPAKDYRFAPSPLGDLIHHQMGATMVRPPGADPNRSLRQRVQDYTTPLSHSMWLGVLFIGVIVWQSRAHGKLIALVPVGFLILSFESVYRAPRHTGLFLLVLIAAMWLVWPDRRTGFRQYRAADLACTALFVLICLPQIAWSERAVRFDITSNYSGSKGCAEYLKAHAAGKTVYGFDYFTVAVAPYFDEPVFKNQPSPYWTWSINNKTDLELDRIVKDRPDYVVMAFNQDAQFGFLISTNLSPGVEAMRNYIIDSQYELVAAFSGSQVMRSSFSENDFFEVYRRPDLTEEEWECLRFELGAPPQVGR